MMKERTQWVAINGRGRRVRNRDDRLSWAKRARNRDDGLSSIEMKIPSF